MADHEALFRPLEADAEAGLEAGLLVRVDRAAELLSRTAPSPAQTVADERARLVSALLTLRPADRTARLKSCGLRLNERLRIESEVRAREKQGGA